MALGFHVNKSAEHDILAALRKGVDNLKKYGFRRPSAQIFIVGPKGYAQTIKDDGEIEEISRFVKVSGLKLVVHGSYVDYPWSLKTANSIHNIRREMGLAQRLGATGVIVHLGNGATDPSILGAIFAGLGKLSYKVKQNVVLWLEINVAKSTPHTFETPDKLGKLFSLLTEKATRGVRVGLCIDTAHLYSCGVGLVTAEQANEWIAKLERRLPGGTPVMMHLNDSFNALNSGLDTHAPLCQGNIWTDYHPQKGRLSIADSGLMSLLEWADSTEMDVILERKEEFLESDLQIISDLNFFK
jgi:endonuclease IV